MLLGIGVTVTATPGLEFDLMALEQATQAPEPGIGTAPLPEQMALHILERGDIPTLHCLLKTLPGCSSYALLAPSLRSLPQ